MSQPLLWGIPTSHLGDVYVQTLYPLLHVPEEADTGLQVRGVLLSCAKPLIPSTNYWVLQFGTISGLVFSTLAEISLVRGLGASLVRSDFSPVLRVPPGHTFALRASTSSKPAPIVGLSVTPVYGIMGSRR